jgi:hypothetical protein
MPSKFLFRATALILLASSTAAFACNGALHRELEHAGV